MMDREQYTFIPATNKHRRYSPFFETDDDRPQIIRSGSRHRKIHQKQQIGLIPQTTKHQNAVQREQVRLYGSRLKSEDQQIYKIKSETRKLEEQLARRQTVSKVKYKVNKRQKNQTRQRVNTYSHDQGIRQSRFNLPITYSRIINTSKKLQPLWEKPLFVQPMTPSKKVYRLKHKPRRTFDYLEYYPRHLATLEDIQVRRFRNPSFHHPMYINRLIRSPQRMKKFRKYVNIVLFTIKLRTFNERMRKKRLKLFRTFSNTQLSQKLQDLKIKIINTSKPFFITIIDQNNFNYQLHDKDEPPIKKEKIISTLKLVNLAIKCMQKCIDDIKDQPYFHQTLYLLCKHGNYSCIEEINTNQEMNLACVSEVFGYMRCDRYLEMSALLSLVFVKIWLYNILLQPNRVDSFVSRSTNPQIIYSNIRLIGTIIYEVLIQIQDEMFERCPPLYHVGNWKITQNKFDFKISESMTVKEGFYIKDELISGLASHNYIQHIYKTKFLISEKQSLITLIKTLHQIIVKYHRIYRKQSFVM